MSSERRVSWGYSVIQFLSLAPDDPLMAAKNPLGRTTVG